MIELMFVACLATEPEACREQSLLFSDITPMTCMMGAQPELAKWSATNPGYEIKHWRCQTVNLSQQDA